jgi:hypothetical protein
MISLAASFLAVIITWASWSFFWRLALRFNLIPRRADNPLFGMTTVLLGACFFSYRRYFFLIALTKSSIPFKSSPLEMKSLI